VVRLIDFYELRLPRRLRLLAMTMFSCVSLRAKRSNLVITCENDYMRQHERRLECAGATKGCQPASWNHCFAFCQGRVSNQRRRSKRSCPPVGSGAQGEALPRRGVAVACLFELEGVMKRPNRQFGVFFLDHAGDLDFGRRDHFNVDALIGQRGEHLRCNA
jgi:hypothetical protein